MRVNGREEGSLISALVIYTRGEQGVAYRTGDKRAKVEGRARSSPRW